MRGGEKSATVTGCVLPFPPLLTAGGTPGNGNGSETMAVMMTVMIQLLATVIVLCMQHVDSIIGVCGHRYANMSGSII